MTIHKSNPRCIFVCALALFRLTSLTVKSNGKLFLLQVKGFTMGIVPPFPRPPGPSTHQTPRQRPIVWIGIIWRGAQCHQSVDNHDHHDEERCDKIAFYLGREYILYLF